jgi:hypothetical protein
MTRHIRDKTMLKQRAQTTKPKIEKPQRAPPAHMQAPPEPMQLPLEQCMQTTWWKQSSCVSSALTGQTGQTGAQQMNRTSPMTGQIGDHDRSDRWHTDPRNGSKPPENLLNAFSRPKHAQTSPPCWQCMNQAQNAKNATQSASQIDKIQQRMLHMSKWAR